MEGGSENTLPLLLLSHGGTLDPERERDRKKEKKTDSDSGAEPSLVLPAASPRNRYQSRPGPPPSAEPSQRPAMQCGCLTARAGALLKKKNNKKIKTQNTFVLADNGAAWRLFWFGAVHSSSFEPDTALK